MPDYISREAAIRAHCDGCVDDGYCGKLDGRYACEDVPNIMAIPAADVVEVVRCRDCYAYQRDKELAEAAYLEPEQYCALLRCEFGPDGFCSYGRRADNG